MFPVNSGVSGRSVSPEESRIIPEFLRAYRDPIVDALLRITPLLIDSGLTETCSDGIAACARTKTIQKDQRCQTTMGVIRTGTPSGDPNLMTKQEGRNMKMPLIIFYRRELKWEEQLGQMIGILLPMEGCVPGFPA